MAIIHQLWGVWGDSKWYVEKCLVIIYRKADGLRKEAATIIPITFSAYDEYQDLLVHSAPYNRHRQAGIL
jgi:hypothetical protein